MVHLLDSAIEVKEVSKQQFQNLLHSDVNNGDHYFSILSNGESIGGAAISKKKTDGVLNYWLEYDYLTSGIGTFVASELIDFAIQKLHLHTIKTECVEPLWGNHAEPFSQKLG
ncbi:hypothetical protein [Bacillus kexueae]|uniref:hypothetical protein n=1 Tax=Aeribacillus kexueae TaxID=2078952 RepID=UPI001FAEBB7F|nr:hypothetical protein [Bacillus kexueae]